MKGHPKTEQSNSPFFSSSNAITITDNQQQKWKRRPSRLARVGQFQAGHFTEAAAAAANATKMLKTKTTAID